MVLHPDNLLRSMSDADRAKLGKAGMTTAEAQAKYTVKLERETHKLISQWLNLNGVTYVHSRTDKRTTQAKGVPDFIIIANNKCLLLEAKREKEKLRPEQLAFKVKCERGGTAVHVIYDAATAIELIRTFLRIL